jgi:hypothetical protein
MVASTIAKSAVDGDPNLVWNTFVELLAMRRYEDLSAEQRPAHLVFWYESEVQNGGHEQYFENCGTEHLDETIAALESLGANCQRSILRAATKKFLATAGNGDLSDFDSRFEHCTLSLVEYLQNHLAQHRRNFVQII